RPADHHRSEQHRRRPDAGTGAGPHRSASGCECKRSHHRCTHHPGAAPRLRTGAQIPALTATRPSQRGSRMRALTYHGSHDVRVGTVPDPTIVAGDRIILKVTATALCGSDLPLYRRSIPQVKHGDIFGPEFLGEVVETGKDAT